MSADVFEGWVGSAGFDKDVAVVAAWRRSPFGRFVDVLWAPFEAPMELYSSASEPCEYVADMYAIKHRAVVPVGGGWDGNALVVETPAFGIRLVGGGRGLQSWALAVRPRRLLRHPAWIAAEDVIAGPIGRRLLHTPPHATAVVSAVGGHQICYGIADCRPVADGHVRVRDGATRPAGDITDGRPVPLGGLPVRPWLLHMTALVTPPNGRLTRAARPGDVALP